jgi:DNA mismatch endonuclease Vsr
MQGNRRTDTGPELKVRHLLHALGYRFRLHVARLPGKPDIVFAGRRKIVEVRGCFWHGHGCGLGPMPRARPGYWPAKITGNRERDGRNMAQLRSLGWDVLEVWECSLAEPEAVRAALIDFLGPTRLSGRRPR